ncbi:hypothetical protein MRX96_031666 [Rhipicephalus microplus]
MQTAAIQTTKQSTSGRNAGTQADFDVRLQITTGMQTDSCDMPLLRARLKQYCDPPCFGLGVWCSSYRTSAESILSGS